MQYNNLKGKFPIVSGEYSKQQLGIETVDELCQYFLDKIAGHPFARYITTFDHYEHIMNIEGHEISDDIVAAKNIIFCFGKKFPNPRILAVRPRSIGICESGSKIIISFLEAPNDALTELMIKWVEELVK